MTTATVDTKVEGAAPAAAAAPATTPETAPAAAEGKTGEAAPPAGPAKAEGAKGDETILGGEKPAEKEAKPDANKQGAPEKYESFKLPEGMELNKDLLAKAQEEFKSLGLSQEAAQKLVTLQAESAKASSDATLQEYQQKVETWKGESTKLYGAKAAEEFAVAGQAINRFGTPELRSLLNETGLGNHPELVKFFVQVGHAIKEDNPADGRKVGEAASDAEIFYGKTMGKK